MGDPLLCYCPVCGLLYRFVDFRDVCVAGAHAGRCPKLIQAPPEIEAAYLLDAGPGATAMWDAHPVRLELKKS